MLFNKKVLGSFPDLSPSFWVYILYQVQKHAHVCRFMHSAEWTCESLVWKHCCDRSPPNTAITPVDLSVWTMRALGEREPATPVWGKWKKQYTPAAILSFPPSILYISVCASPRLLTHTQTYAAPIDVYLLKSLCRCCSCIYGNLTIVDIRSKWTNNNLVRQ